MIKELNIVVHTHGREDLWDVKRVAVTGANKEGQILVPYCTLHRRQERSRKIQGDREICCM